MLIPKFFGFEVSLILFFVDFLEGVLESSIVFLQNGVFGGHVEGVVSLKGKLETAVSEFFNGLVGVVHAQSNTSVTCEFVDFHFFFRAIISFENNFELSWLVNSEVGGLVLITKGMSSNDDGFFPARDESGDVADDDGFSEDGAVENVPDGSIWAFPHFLQFELLNSGLIGSNGGTFDTDLTLFDGISGIDGDLVICGISIFHAQIKIFDREVEEGENKFILDSLPDNPCHLIAIELSNWVWRQQGGAHPGGHGRPQDPGRVPVGQCAAE